MNLVWQSCALIAGHFMGDYVFQGDTMAKSKNPIGSLQLLNSQPVPWFYWMTAHCFVHATIVAAITGSLVFAIVEFLIHFFLDYSKCQKWIGINTDQTCHLLTKAAFIWASFA